MGCLTISGFQTRHLFCYRVMWTPKTTFSREAHPLSTVCTFVHSLKCTDWFAISKQGIIGPFWFDDNEHCLTINIDFQVLCKFWTALGRHKVVVMVCHWFQQDGTTPHTSKESVGWFTQRFPDRLISCKCDPQWSPYSPDLNPPDFYL